ncbi:MAG: precorrin-2 dehydrogenase/sirohydrochlorin ferrochelatase family protein, partial [Syntrophales bacterium]
MKYYPLFLDITNRKCVVVGGGDVAERKMARLLHFSACVVVVGKTLTPGLEAMNKAGKIEHIDADYDRSFIDDAFLV